MWKLVEVSLWRDWPDPAKELVPAVLALTRLHSLQARQRCVMARGWRGEGKWEGPALLFGS